MEKNNAISSDLIRGHIDTIILHTLLDGDKFAAQIIESVEKKSLGEYVMNQATLYSSLKRLENLKQVSSYWFDSDGGRRKYFKITDLGKKTVDDNLSNWSYSRGIIDKLMDLETKPIYKTQIVEVEKEVIKEVPVNAASSIPNPIINKPKTDAIEPKEVSTDKIVIPEKEVNYKGVLDDIIKTTVINRQDIIEIKPIDKENNVEQNLFVEQDKPKLNDSLSSNKYNAPIDSNVGKVDFGDIVLDATTEGYKVKISSKNLKVPDGKTYKNKLGLFSSIAVYIIFLIQFFVLSARYGDSVNFSSAISIITVLAFALFPIANLINFIINPKKKTHKTISIDILFTALIIVFNLILVTFACNLIFETDFASVRGVVIGVVAPSLVCLDVLIYFVCKYFFSKLKIVKVK